MSNDIFSLIPADTQYVPDPETQQAAKEQMTLLFPKAGAIRTRIYEQVEFMDPGGNLEHIRCPACGKEIEGTWWTNAMDTARKGKFENLSVKTPCCAKAVSLNDLNYDWPAGFARFALQAEDPDGDLGPDQLSHFENILGCRLRIVRSHY